MISKNFENTIELSNDGKVSLFFIGTGSAFSKRYFQTNLLLVKGNTHLLVDCGSLCPYALETSYNTSIKNINNLLITHPHADHIGGVEELVFVDYYSNKQKVNLIINDSLKKQLWNFSLRGGMQYSEKGKMTFNDYFNQIKPVQICKKPFPVYEVDFNGINLKIFRTRHVASCKNSFKKSQPSYGLIIDNKVLFTGDTQFYPDQLKWIDEHYEIEAVFHDCDISGYSSGVHATYTQLKTLSEEFKKKMYLCHYNEAAEKIDVTADGFAGFANAGVYYKFD